MDNGTCAHMATRKIVKPLINHSTNLKQPQYAQMLL